MSGLVGESLKEEFQQCKELMVVSDEEFAAFELQKQRQSVSNTSADNKKDKFLNELFENDARLESAIEEGKCAGKQSE
ncbi:MAG: hypothetical protein J6X51_03350 [Bacteroidales bacterium]|nr:hypothetical protein [Bacteroidales bacterium]